jgi:hypothetical protein
MTQSRVSEQKKLKKKAELLWRLVTTTAGVADLAEPMKRVEHYFERLTKRQRVTVAMIVTQLVKGFNEIDAEIEAEIATETQVEESAADKGAQDQSPRIETSATYGKTEGPQAIEPDEIIPAGQDEVGDGSGTGD